MPELPEVETLRQELLPAVKNKMFADIFCDTKKLISPAVAEFRKIIKGKIIKSISRRGKMLIFELEKDLFLLIHLKMSGQLIFCIPEGDNNHCRLRGETEDLLVRRLTGSSGMGMVAGGHPQKGGAKNLPNKFTHIYFTFTDGSVLYFNDLRKFGWTKLVDKVQVGKLLREFGVEPLSKEFTAERLKKILERRPNKKIKQVLMEQNLIAGIGNIYADESCFCAGILPTRKVKSLKPAEVAKLHQCIPEILKFAIQKKGTSANTYAQLTGEPGGMAPYLKVYGREGEKCHHCSGIVKKIKLGGRGTHFCPRCQR